MATKTLVIDGSDPDRFFLGVEGSTLRVGSDPKHPEGGLRGLRVVRIHCEVVVEDDRDFIAIDWCSPEQIGELPREKEVRNGAAVQFGKAHLAVVPDSLSATHAPLPPAVPPTPAAAAPIAETDAGRKQLRVVDGGDQGRFFALPEAGRAVIGKRDGHADIVLNDLYVNRTHCTLTVKDGSVTVVHNQGDSGTRIDGRKIEGPEVLPLGGVLRVGNSHLKLERHDPAKFPPPTSPAAAPVEKPAAGPPSGRIRATAIEGEAQTLGHYELGPVVGRGFASTVHRATDLKTKQIVALKVFPAAFPASPAEADRFGQALRTAMPVHHPHLVGLFGAGKSGAQCWLAREFVEGESAADAVTRAASGAKPSWTRAARVVVHMARVLGALHENRLVHGNITPRNVLLRKSDQAALLADLRFAEALDGSKLQQGYAEKKRLVELGYLAPEQLHADANVDALADLYAVGAVAYALIAGHPPSAAKTTAERLRENPDTRPARPSSFYKKVPGAFDAVVLKLVAHHQEARYSTAAALLADMAPIAQEHDLKA